MKTGVAKLPLHPGKAPKWLFSRMVALAGGITDVILDEYGQEEFLNRLSNPFWFQCLGNVLGFDWHSSGLTTTTCGAIKESQKGKDNGLFILGGKGKVSKEVPEKLPLMNFSDTRTRELIQASKLSAKVDNSVLQDGYQLYHHVLAFTEKGRWSVVQQGMGNDWARRYHWLDDAIETDFVEEPHAAICCDRKGDTLDLTARESAEARKTSVDLLNDNPVHLQRFFGKSRQQTLDEFSPGYRQPKVLNLPKHHLINETDLTERDFKVLHKVYEIQPASYQELVSLKGMGPKRIRALALVANVIHGSELSWKDPVKYSFAHGGKDGTPYPVNREVYDHTIQQIRESLYKAEVGEKEKRGAWRRLGSLVDGM